MRIIYDNIIFSLQKAGGISVYWYELINRLKGKNNTLIYDTKNENIFRKTLRIETQQESMLPSQLRRYLPFIKKIPSKSIFHSSYYRISLQKDIVNIITIHDFTYEYYMRGIARYIHSWQKKFSIRHSDGIICVSENTKKDLLKFFPQMDESKIKVIYNGVSDKFRNQKKCQFFQHSEFKPLINRKYILYIGDRSKYKNFTVTVKALNKMIDYTLVIVGGKELSDNELLGMKALKNRMFHFKGICEEKLNVLYNNAFCLLYPSSYEGFGIPIVEAMRTGCPVVSTNMSSIPEVAGTAAVLVDKITADNLICAINKLENEQFRNDLIQKGLIQSTKFNWDKCFQETYTFYEEIFKKKFYK